jgi:small subunit ribosomal protein S8
MSTDMIADFLTIIRNAVMSSAKTVETSASRVRLDIAKILKDEGFIKDYAIVEDGTHKNIKVFLKYVQGESAIHEITRISKSSRRVYSGINELKPVINGLGISILTTNKGVMTDKQAKRELVGGEIICTVW